MPYCLGCTIDAVVGVRLCSNHLLLLLKTVDMGKMQKGRVADLSRILQRVTASLNDTFALLNEAAPAASEKGDWAQVKKAADLVSKNATTIGLLWTQGAKVDEAGEAMKNFADSLQGLLLLCHACTVGAGPTLSSTIRSAVKLVLEAGLSLLMQAVSFSVKGSAREEREGALPSLVGCVGESCNALKKTPFTNRAAIGRSLAQVATSVKDVLREIGEMREGRAVDHADCGHGHSHEDGSGACSHGHDHSAHSHRHDHSGHGNCGHDHGQDNDHSAHLHTHEHSGHGQCRHDHGGHQHHSSSNNVSYQHSHSHSGHNHSQCGHDHGNQGHVHTHGHSHQSCGHDHSHAGHSHSHGNTSHANCGHDHGNAEHEDGSSSVDSMEFNEELSPEEMQVVDATKGVVNSLLDFLKQLFYVAGDPQQGDDENSTLYLENVLKHCKNLGVEVDEFGASLYPPQEIKQLSDLITKSDALVEQIKDEVKATKGAVPEGLETASQAVMTAETTLKLCISSLS